MATAPQQKSTHEVVGLRQIAEELNVSVSLVSKVLSGRMGTSGANAATIRTIREKAAQLGYRKNMLAEALRTGRQNVIAVCIHRHGVSGSGIVEDMVHGIATEAAVHQQRLMLQYSETIEELRELSLLIHRNAVDGLILGGIPHPEWVDEMHEISRRNVPIVTIHDRQVARDIVNVTTDQVELSRRATLHLIEQGCSRIVHIHPSFGEGFLPLARERHEGYRSALTQRALRYQPDLVIEVEGFTYDQGMAATRRLLASGAPFDGIVAQSDQLAIGALNVLIREGRRVPEDVKLIGVDNSPFCDLAIVPLSSMSQSFNLRGQQAVRLLMQMLAGQKVGSVVIDSALHVRASSGLSARATRP